MFDKEFDLVRSRLFLQEHSSIFWEQLKPDDELAQMWIQVPLFVVEIVLGRELQS
jgi:hypothetical protein